jgi:DNA-binding response OmpR family regulator
MLRVLVVEDDPMIRSLLERTLAVAGHRVQTAATAEEAAAYIGFDIPMTPDVAVLDLVLPGASGLEYGRSLKHQFPGIRLVFMTGWQDRVAAHTEARREGPLLHKPFTVKALLAAIGDNRHV